MLARLAGWRAFCAGVRLDPDACWQPLPGFATVRLAEEKAAEVGVSREDVIQSAWAKDKPELKFLTAESAAAELRASFDARMAFWG